MTFEQFHNGLRILHSLDTHEVDGIEAHQGHAMVNDPVRYLIRCDDDTAQKIWAAMVKRGATK